ncbi:hypothetical protein Angca_000104, partial [Angiostrongylus cantonensis]
KSLHQPRTAMYHQPLNRKRAFNMSMLTVSGPTLQPYFPKKRKTFVCGKILDVATIPHRIARWHSLRSQLGRYLIAFEPLTFV